MFTKIYESAIIFFLGSVFSSLSLLLVIALAFDTPFCFPVSVVPRMHLTAQQ